MATSHEGTTEKVLDWAYEQALSGLPGSDTVEEFASSYLRGPGTIRAKADALIRWQNAKAATSGFVNGLPGIALMPVTVPASLSICWYVQLRMVAAIAHMGGHDVRDDRVKTLAYICLCGNGAKELLKELGVVIGAKLTQQLIRSISVDLIKSVNKAVGFRLVTKFGQSGALNLGKAVPLIGGIIGGAFDGVTTNIIGNVARNTFFVA